MCCTVTEYLQSRSNPHISGDPDVIRTRNRLYIFFVYTMTDLKEETTGSAVHGVTIRLTTFWPDLPAVWFAQVEEHFEVTSATRQRTKFKYVVSAQPAAQGGHTRLQTHWTSPDNRLHRADSLTRSHTGPLRASPDNRLPRRDSLVHSLAKPLRASPDNWLPKTDSLARRLARYPCLSGQQTAQDGLTRPQPRRISMPLRMHRTLSGPFHPLTSSLCKGVMWEQPHGELLRSHHSSPSSLNASTIDRAAMT